MIRRSLITGTVLSIVWLSGCSQGPSANATEKSSGLARGSEPELEVPKPPPVPRKVTIPAGTVVSVRTASSLSTKTNRWGEVAQATLENPLTAQGEILAPKGANAALIVAKSDPGGRVKGRASIGVRLGSLQIAGEAHPLSTNVYVQQAPGTKKKDGLKIGALSGAGAAIGALAGGGGGAAIGAASGAGAGTAVVLATRGAPAVIPAESVIQYRLLKPLTVELN